MDARAFAFAAFTGWSIPFRPRAFCPKHSRIRTEAQTPHHPGKECNHPAAATAPFLPAAVALALADFLGSTATFSMEKSLRGAIFAVARVAGVSYGKAGAQKAVMRAAVLGTRHAHHNLLWRSKALQCGSS